jgi:hypothetical protein
MKKKQINIAGHLINSVNRSDYESENKTEGLDFYFRVGFNKVETMVFDSLENDKEKAYLGVFFTENLAEAVQNSMLITKGEVRSFVMWQ